eukprot:gb/GECH01000888.1/.p1 GENE.gb/GECH01000888.1/~~gb/GECH01000888.1/.p1  ORF type:complete len:1257 (+),score=317.96 gb/GECH01000888.1/:1-3771(+)
MFAGNLNEVDFVHEDDQTFERVLKTEIRSFEETVLNNIGDSLERAIHRKNFHDKLREIRKQRDITRGYNQKAKKKGYREIRHRKFQCFYEQQYSGTIIRDDILNEKREMSKLSKLILTSGSKENRNHYPVFLGEDGTLYDINYVPLPVDEVEREKHRGRFSTLLHRLRSQSEEEAAPDATSHSPLGLSDEDPRLSYFQEYEFVNNPVLFSSLPEPEHFDNFAEFEESLLQWQHDVHRSLGYLQPPRVTGRAYLRPRLVSSKKNEDDEQDYGNEQILYDPSMDKPCTWEAELVPLEPHPEFYDSYEDYEKALLRWFVVCAGMEFVPPHPAQMEHLLSIDRVQQPQFPETEDEEKEKEQQSSNSDKKERSRHDSSIVSGDTSNHDDEDENEDRNNTDGSNLKVHNQWNQLPDDIQFHIHESFEKLVDQKEKNKKQFNAYHREHVPTIHGVVQNEEKVMRRLSLSRTDVQVQEETEGPASVRDWVVDLRRERSLSSVIASNLMSIYQAMTDDLQHQLPLRKEDYSEDDDPAYDCNPFANSNQITFKVPEFDIGQIDFNLLDDHGYTQFLQILLTRIDEGHRYDPLNSWYWPKISPETLEEDKQDLSYLAQVEHPSQLMQENILQVFQTNAYLDTFNEWLETSIPVPIDVFFKGEQKTVRNYSQLLFAAATKENFKAVLQLFERSRSKLVHAKVGSWVLGFLGTDRAEVELKKLIHEKDIKHLHLVAKATTFYDEVPTKLFELSDDQQALALQYHGPEVQNAIRQMILLYYISSTAVSLIEEEDGFPAVYPMLLTQIEAVQEDVINYFTTRSQTTSQVIWSLIGSRSKSLSELGLFLICQMFVHSYHPQVKDFLSEQCDVVENLRHFAVSKMSHVRRAVSTIFLTIRSYKWSSMLLRTYSDPNTVSSDLLDAASHSALDSQAPLISSIVFEFLRNTYESAGEENRDGELMVQKHIEADGFHVILDQVLDTYTQHRMHQGTIMGAMMCEMFAKHALRLNLIVAKKDKRNTTGVLSMLSRRSTMKSGNDSNSSSNKLAIRSSDLIQMIDFVSEGGRRPREYVPKRYIVNVLNHLFKYSPTLDLVRRDDRFFTKVRDVCQDGNDMEFNKSAWAMLYSMCKYNTGVIELLHKYNVLKSLIECMDSDNAVVTTNSLYYFNLILQLPAMKDISYHEDAIIVPSEEVRRKYESTINTLVGHMAKEFSVLHSAYEKLSLHSAGWPFQCLARLYNTINTSYQCQRLLRAAERKPDWKEGLDYISKMNDN